MNKPNNVLLENAEIWMATKNFSGRKNKFGNATPGFCVFLSDKQAAQMDADGWNIKMAKPREEGDPPRPYIQVSISYSEEYPRLNPRIWKVTSRNKMLMDAETLGSLDYDEFQKVDLVLRPYVWDTGMNSGVKAYVKEMFITVEESLLESKYFGDEPYTVDDEEAPF